jgi:hypothetical protein
LGARWKRYRAKIVDEKSREWLFWKGFGSATALVIAGIAAYATIGIFNISLTVEQSKELGRLETENKKLKTRLDKYESKRFVVHKEETRILFSDVYFHFYGFNNNYYKIYKFDQVLIEEERLPQGKPDIFIVNGDKYFVLAERVFRTANSSRVDSAIIYIDSLSKK